MRILSPITPSHLESSRLSGKPWRGCHRACRGQEVNAMCTNPSGKLHLCMPVWASSGLSRSAPQEVVDDLCHVSTDCVLCVNAAWHAGRLNMLYWCAALITITALYLLSVLFKDYFNCTHMWQAKIQRQRPHGKGMKGSSKSSLWVSGGPWLSVSPMAESRSKWLLYISCIHNRIYQKSPHASTNRAFTNTTQHS